MREAVSAVSDIGAPDRWRWSSIATGLAGSVLASFCCLPAAAAIALGVSMSTVATLSQLANFQRYFQIAGMAVAGLAAWWIVRRSQGTCSLSERVHRRGRVPLFVFGAFALGFAILNLGVIPFLEELPWLMP